jgi:hypothetical protein
MLNYTLCASAHLATPTALAALSVVDPDVAFSRREPSSHLGIYAGLFGDIGIDLGRRLRDPGLGRNSAAREFR